MVENITKIGISGNPSISVKKLTGFGLCLVVVMYFSADNRVKWMYMNIP